MLNLKKEADSLKTDEFRLSNCPVCSSYVCHMYFMQDSTTKKQSKWFSCSCGVVFQDKKPDMIYDQKYWDKYAQFDKKLREAYEYPIRIYAPLIEELIYGRKALLIGRVTQHQEDYFAERGWVPTSIDKNESQVSDRLITADFETHPFLETQKYNLIWIYQTLECFIDPVLALNKCKSLLTEDGIIYIDTVDTDFINTRGSSSFIHWKPEYNHIMWNKRALTKHLESLGFNVIMCRSNYEHRFTSWDSIQLIAQKKFF